MVVLAAVIVIAVGLFRGGFTAAVPITVVSARAGLVMNPDAKVEMRGVQVGKVDWIELRPNGQAALHLALNPSQLSLIPTNVDVDITSTTVFGAKFVNFVPPAAPSSTALHAGQVLAGQHITVETNTIFQQLNSVLSTIQPEKLNEALGALARSLNGRGHQIGQTFDELDSFLARLQPGLPALRHDLATLPPVLGAYADASADLMTAVDNGTQISRTIVAEQHNLDALLLSTIGLADIGDDVIGTNRRAMADVLHLMAPTTDLTNQYHDALRCGLAGLVPYAKAPKSPLPGVQTAQSPVLGIERYRYPKDLPKVAASGRPQCMDLPNVPFDTREPYLVTDIGANPWQYGNQGILLNSDALKQWLFGPIDGPPRNTIQIGQPG